MFPRSPLILRKSGKRDKIIPVKLFVFLIWTLFAVSFGMFLNGQLDGYGRSSEEGAIIKEKDDDDYKRGVDFANEGRIELAVNCFEKVIEKNPVAIDSYLQIGTLKKQENRPFEAVYYLQQYLRRANLSENDSRSRIVRGLIESAKEDFLRTIPGRPHDAYTLSDTVEKKYTETRRENDDLKRRLALAEARIRELETYAAKPSPQPPLPAEIFQPKPAAPVPAEVRPAPAPAPAQVYVVQQGDTLGKISRKFYGTTGRWEEILNYNKNILSDPTKLRPGMELKIPPK